MIFGMFSIRDVKTGFMTPDISVSPDAAIRNFSIAMSRPDVLYQSFIRDFDLYQIGDFDSDSGVVTPLVPPVFVISASDALGLIHREGGASDAGEV